MKEIKMNEEKNATAVQAKIRNEIANLLHTRFNVPEASVSESAEGWFFGLHALLTPRELTYLAHMLEMQYNIQFCSPEYDDPRFYSLAGLSEIIEEKTALKSCKTSDNHKCIPCVTD